MSDKPVINAEMASLLGRSLSENYKKHIRWAAEKLQAIKTEVRKDVVEMDRNIDETLIAKVGAGNVLAEGVPGLAKTLTFKSIAYAGGSSFKRIQCTPDLQPIDLTGTEVPDKNNPGEYVFRPGPLFAQDVLLDELNRASEKTQSATLEAMAERQISTDGVTRKMERPFIVMATQNPIDQGGTNKIPEAQADRFMIRTIFHYSSRMAEQLIALKRTSSTVDLDEAFARMQRFEETKDPADDLTKDEDIDRALKAQQVATPQNIVFMQDLARRLPVSEDVLDAVTDIVLALRPESSNDPYIKENVKLGPSPRGEIDLLMAAKSRVLVSTFLKSNGAVTAPTVDDVVAMAAPVLLHRLMLNDSRKDYDVTEKDVLQHVLKKLNLPQKLQM